MTTFERDALTHLRTARRLAALTIKEETVRYTSSERERGLTVHPAAARAHAETHFSPEFVQLAREHRSTPTPGRCGNCGEADRTKGSHGLGRCV